MLLFVGGPLDGRVEVRAARHGEPPPTVTHVYLHEGPKVVHRYDLQPLPGQTGVYHVRPRTGARPDDDAVPDDAVPDDAVPDDAVPDDAVSDD